MAPVLELSADQKTQLVELIATYTRDELGPIVKDVVEEHLKTVQPNPDSQFKNMGDVIRSLTGAPNIAPQEKDKGLMFGRLLRSLAAGKCDPDKAIKYATEKWGEDDRVIKALAAGEATAGGFIVPPGYSDEIIELLTPMAIVRASGAVTMPMETGTLQVPKLTTGSAANYVGENEDIPESQPVFGMVNLTAKKLGVLVPLSNDLIRFSRPNADAVARNDTLRAMRVKEDIQFIRGVGSDFSPKGIRRFIPAASLITVNATVNLANVTTDLGKLVLALVEADVGMTTPGWMMAPRTWNFLMNIRDANGNFAFRPEMREGTLWGFPFRMTSQIPTNLAVTGTDESEVYLVDFADVVIGEAQNLIIDTSTEASYLSGGTLVSAFSRDQTLIRVIAQHDLNMRHNESAAALIDVDWV